MQALLVDVEQLVLPAGILGGTFLLGLLLSQILFSVAGMVAKRANSAVGQLLVKHGRGPAGIIIPLLLVQMLTPAAQMPEGSREVLTQALTIILAISTGWLIIRLTNVVEDLIFLQYRIDVSDNLQARKIHTQIRFLKRLVMVIVGVLTLAVVLMTFDRVRQVGTSILASAGVAGIIIGFAAQKSIANLLAGFQIAFTGPINIDDVVIVEGEWGRIEEITLTYVVVRIWDLRRLIVPITYFIENPFQNWTRVSADLLGTVFLYFDYTVPVQAVREELQQILENSPLWDKKVSSVQVTNSTEHTMEVRALMSAANSSDLWSLRCEVREKLVAFIQNNYPDSLPRMRAELLESGKEIRMTSKAGKANLDKPQN